MTPTSTSTQVNSDTPREAPPADLIYGGPAAGSMVEAGVTFSDETLRRKLAQNQGEWYALMHEARGQVPEDVLAGYERGAPEQPHKVSSPELASLAAKYLTLDADAVHVMLQPEQEALALAVRRLAASVLSQAEPHKEPEA